MKNIRIFYLKIFFFFFFFFLVVKVSVYLNRRFRSDVAFSTLIVNGLH